MRVVGLGILIAAGLLCSGDVVDAQELDQKQKWAISGFKKYLDAYAQNVAAYRKDLEKCSKSEDTKTVLKDSGRNIRGLDQLTGRIDYYAADFNKKNCPEDHKDVKALRAQEKKIRAEIVRMKGAFETVKAQALEAWDPKSYPDLDTDIAQFQLLKKHYTYQWRTQEEFNEFADIWKGLPKSKAWIDEREKHYSRFMTGNDPRGAELKKLANYVRRQYKFQKDKMEKIINQAIQNTQNLLYQVQRMIKGKIASQFEKGGKGLQFLIQADGLVKALAEILGADHATVKQLAKNHKAVYEAASAFSKAAKEESINSAIKDVEEKLKGHEDTVAKLPGSTWYSTAEGMSRDLDYLVKSRLSKLIRLVGAGDSRVKAFENRIQVLRDKMPEILKKVRLNVIERNTKNFKAKNVYQGGDRGDLQKKLLAKWKEEYPKEEVLEVRFSMETWKRKVETVTWLDESTNTIRSRLDDYSRLLVTVLVKLDDKIAVKHVAGFYRDHMANDRFSINVRARGLSNLDNYIWRSALDR